MPSGTATTTTAEAGALPVTVAVPSVVSVPAVDTAPRPTALSVPASSVAPDFGITPECLEVLYTLAADIEPIVGAFDFAGGAIADYAGFMVSLQDPFSVVVAGVGEHGCDTIGDLAPPGSEAAFLAELGRRSPGAVPFFEIVTAPPRHAFADDCQGQSDALAAYVADGGTFADLAPVDKYNVTQLYTGLQTWCGLEFGHAVTLSSDVQAFIGVAP